MKKPVQAENQPPESAAPAQILIVDDDTCIFDVFREMFQPLHCAIAVAANGHVALELAAAGAYDLAFVDFYMIGMNGVEVSQKLRKLQPNMKVVLMSGYFMDERAEAVERAGARAFLTKPFSVEAVLALAGRLLGNQRAEPCRPVTAHSNSD